MFNIENSIQTLNNLSNKLLSSDCVYFVRFGDGEFGLCTKLHGSKYQPENDILTNELKESILISDPNYIIALMLYNDEPGMTSGVFSHTSSNKEKWTKWLINDLKLNTQCVYANQATLSWLAIKEPALIVNFLNKHIRNKRIMFIGQTEKKLAEQLVGPITEYVNTPFYDAYQSIDSIFDNVISGVNKCDIILSACGPSSKVIAKRLWNLNIKTHFLDIGSLIGIVDTKKTHGWQQPTLINKVYKILNYNAEIK